MPHFNKLGNVFINRPLAEGEKFAEVAGGDYQRKTYELLTQAINEARDRGDIELLELIAKDPQAFILKQGWASISLDVSRGLMELRSLYEHLRRQTRSETLRARPAARRRSHGGRIW